MVVIERGVGLRLCSDRCSSDQGEGFGLFELPDGGKMGNFRVCLSTDATIDADQWSPEFSVSHLL